MSGPRAEGRSTQHALRSTGQPPRRGTGPHHPKAPPPISPGPTQRPHVLLARDSAFAEPGPRAVTNGQQTDNPRLLVDRVHPRIAGDAQSGEDGSGAAAESLPADADHTLCAGDVTGTSRPSPGRVAALAGRRVGRTAILPQRRRGAGAGAPLRCSFRGHEDANIAPASRLPIRRAARHLHGLDFRKPENRLSPELYAPGSLSFFPANASQRRGGERSAPVRLESSTPLAGGYPREVLAGSDALVMPAILLVDDRTAHPPHAPAIRWENRV